MDSNQIYIQTFTIKRSMNWESLKHLSRIRTTTYFCAYICRTKGTRHSQNTTNRTQVKHNLKESHKVHICTKCNNSNKTSTVRQDTTYIHHVFTQTCHHKQIGVQPHTARKHTSTQHRTGHNTTHNINVHVCLKFTWTCYKKYLECGYVQHINNY